jgi:VIT1/CCC1 family predicted Fe2+/Mn2+ transporter
MSLAENWIHEKESVFLYAALAEAEHVAERRALFVQLAREAEGQAATWAEVAAKAGERLPEPFAPRTRVRIVAALARRLGPERIRPVLAAMKVRGLSIYGYGYGYGAPAAKPGHAMPRSVADVEADVGTRHHAAAKTGNLRAAVFGVNDGLVSNASLILGVAGATTAAGSDGHAVLLSGAAGLLAGAFSMAAGEYVSVRSQREMLERQIAAEREELALYPEQEAAELSVIYQARGLPKEDADRIAERIVASPRYALDTLAREELGLDPESLGSPFGAALSSFVAFAVGASVPLVPFLVTRGPSALPAAVGLTAAALFGVGAAISLFSDRPAVRGGLRMLLIGAAAAAATFLIGRLLGAAVA